MAIKVYYDELVLAEGSNPQAVKQLMCRDASWGTYVEELRAVLGSCGPGTIDRCRALEPKVINTATGQASDSRFALEIPHGNFSFDSEGADHFVGTIAGDILLHPAIKHIRVQDFEFTDPELFSSFPGPNVGIQGLYDSLLKATIKGKGRPVIAFTVKPRIGLNVAEYVQLYSEAAAEGIDIVEDDERLINPASCKFDERVRALVAAQKKFGGIYSPNITGDSATALDRLEYCAKHGIRMVKCDVLVSGFETLRKLALRIRDKYNSSIAITVYPDAYGAYRNLSSDFILRLSRLCGADMIYAGSPNWARYSAETGELKTAIDPVFQRHEFLSAPFGKDGTIKPSLPSITNDQHPSRAEAVITYLRKHKSNHFRYAFFVGGGISGFPATSIREAARVWVRCVHHAATSSLSNYKGFDFGKYDAKMRSIGWVPLDVTGALK
jgi:ribulose 1,5-bisphosphate carboxylase large subunit-like protein